MMQREDLKLLIALPILALTASAQPNSGSDSLGPASLVRAMGLRIGGWRTTLTLTRLTLDPHPPNAELSEGARSAAQRAVGQSYRTEDCIGTLPARDGSLILPGITIADECTFSEVRASDGRLVLNASCGNASNGFAASVRVEAFYTATSMNAEVDSTVYSAAGGGIIARTRVSTESAYSGACNLLPDGSRL